MNDSHVRELVRIRLELRQLVVLGGRPEAAAALISRMDDLAALEPAGGVDSEAGRWRSRFRIDERLNLLSKI